MTECSAVEWNCSQSLFLISAPMVSPRIAYFIFLARVNCSRCNRLSWPCEPIKFRNTRVAVMSGFGLGVSYTTLIHSGYSLGSLLDYFREPGSTGVILQHHLEHPVGDEVSLILVQVRCLA